MKMHLAACFRFWLMLPHLAVRSLPSYMKTWTLQHMAAAGWLLLLH